MNPEIEKRVAQLVNSDVREALRGRQVGLEKESLRVAVDGGISQKRHPQGLGSPLTHPSITTDYSEALLELVTPPFNDFDDTLQFLDDTHRFVYGELQDEILWSTSMPCVVDGDQSIRLAQYGSSNAATMKTAYRRGLGHRYGRMMQTIAGVHFNYSYPDKFWEIYQSLINAGGDRRKLMDDAYLGMIRNLMRYGWLVPYLFGASPAICASFLGASNTSLQKWQKYSYYGPYATSLRVGDIGYQNNKEGEAGIRVGYNSLNEYIEGLTYAISTPYPEYQAFGLERDGKWQQLNSNILQIENEHYSSVRPKQILQGEEKPTLALARRGVAYIELRSLDVNVFEPLGINREQMLFLESFLLFSLLIPSPPSSEAEQRENKHNTNIVAERGRDPNLKLKRKGKDICLRDWAHEIFDQIEMGCELLDKGAEDFFYCSALQKQRNKITNPDSTPSARVLEEMSANGEEFYHFSLRKSREHQQGFADRPLDGEQLKTFKQTAQDSIDRQHAIEAGDDISFAGFLQNYFAQS
ncbi:MAG: glutamate--cysteine ligase [Pseudomonadota bacterium]